MKNKNTIIALFAFQLAVGIAFATKAAIVPQDAYIEVRLSQNSPWICVDTNKECDDQGSSCNITVMTTVAGLKTVRGKKDITQCVVPLNHSNAAPQTVSTFTVYDAR